MSVSKYDGGVNPADIPPTNEPDSSSPADQELPDVKAEYSGRDFTIFSGLSAKEIAEHPEYLKLPMEQQIHVLTQSTLATFGQKDDGTRVRDDGKFDDPDFTNRDRGVEHDDDHSLDIAQDHGDAGFNDVGSQLKMGRDRGTKDEFDFKDPSKTLEDFRQYQKDNKPSWLKTISNIFNPEE